MSVIRTLSAVTLLLSLGSAGSTNAQGVSGSPGSGVPAKRAYAAPERERRVMTAAEKREFDAYLDRIERQAVKSTAYSRQQEKQGVLTVKESARLNRIQLYIQNKRAVPDAEIDFALRLIKRGPLVKTDINRVRLRMRAISMLGPGNGLTEAQQQRAIKVIGPIANDPPKEKIVYFDGVQSPEISVQLVAIGFLSSTQHPEALKILRTLQKRTRVKEARKRIDEYLESLQWEEQGVLTIKESRRLYIMAVYYLDYEIAVPDEEVDFALHLIKRGPLVNTDINRVRLRRKTISSLLPGSGLTKAQQQRAIKVIGPITNDPPKEKIVYFNGIRSPEISVQLTAIDFLASTRHPEALRILRTLQKKTQVKEARKRIDVKLASLDAR